MALDGAAPLHTVLARDYLPTVLKDKKALIDRLKTLAGVLRELEQTDEHELYAPTASALAALRTHADEDVRLLVACCLADVLRIYAPAAPFDADVLHQVFRLFIAQLRGLADPTAPRERQKRLEYLLERLALVKAFVLLIELDLLGEITELTDALFAAIRVEHSIKIEAAMHDILYSLLDELESVPAPLLTRLLRPLHGPAGNKPGGPRESGNGPAAQLARRVLRSAEGLLAPVVSEYFTLLLFGGADVTDGAADGEGDNEEEEGDDDSEDVLRNRGKRGKTATAAGGKKKSHKRGVSIALEESGIGADGAAEERTLAGTHTLVLELATCAPSLLASVLPRLELQLRAPAEGQRLTACRLLARVFAANDEARGNDKDDSSGNESSPTVPPPLSGAPVAVCYKELYESFLSRTHDVAEPVRLAALEHLPGQLKALARAAAGALDGGGGGGGDGTAATAARLGIAAISAARERLLDPAETVREAAVLALCDWAAEAGPSALPEGTLKELADRARDRKKRVADVARSRLSELYRAHADAGARGGREGVRAAQAVSILPAALLAGRRADCAAGLLEAEGVLDALLPHTPLERAKALAALHTGLDPSGRALLAGLVRQKARSQAALRAWVDAKDAAAAGGGAGGKGTIVALLKGRGGNAAPALSTSDLLVTQARELAVTLAPQGDAKAAAAHAQLWRSLGASRNARIGRALRALATPSTDLESARAMGTELRVLVKTHLTAPELAALDSATRALTPSVVWVGMAAAALRPLLRLTGRGPEEEEEEEEEGEEEAQDDVDFDFTEDPSTPSRSERTLSARAARSTALWPLLEASAPQVAQMLAPRWPAGVSALVNAIEGSRESTDGLRTLLSIGAHVPPAAVEAEMASPQKTGKGAGKGKRASTDGAGALPPDALAALVRWATRADTKAAGGGSDASIAPRVLPKLVAEYVCAHAGSQPAAELATALARHALGGSSGGVGVGGALLALKRVCVLAPAAFAPWRAELCTRATEVASEALAAAEGIDPENFNARVDREALAQAEHAGPWVRLYGAALAARAAALTARAAGAPLIGVDDKPNVKQGPEGGEPCLAPLTEIICSSASSSDARTSLVSAALSALTRALAVDALRARLPADDLFALGWLAGDDEQAVGLLAVRKVLARLAKPPYRVSSDSPLARSLGRRALPPHLLCCVLTAVGSKHKAVKKAGKDGATAYVRQLRATAAQAAVAARNAGANTVGAGAHRSVGLLAEMALPWLVWLVSRDESLMDEDAVETNFSNAQGVFASFFGALGGGREAAAVAADAVDGDGGGALVAVGGAGGGVGSCGDVVLLLHMLQGIKGAYDRHAETSGEGEAVALHVAADVAHAVLVARAKNTVWGEQGASGLPAGQTGATFLPSMLLRAPTANDPPTNVARSCLPSAFKLLHDAERTTRPAAAGGVARLTLLTPSKEKSGKRATTPGTGGSGRTADSGGSAKGKRARKQLPSPIDSPEHSDAESGLDSAPDPNDGSESEPELATKPSPAAKKKLVKSAAASKAPKSPASGGRAAPRRAAAANGIVKRGEADAVQPGSEEESDSDADDVLARRRKTITPKQPRAAGGLHAPDDDSTAFAAVRAAAGMDRISLAAAVAPDEENEPPRGAANKPAANKAAAKPVAKPATKAAAKPTSKAAAKPTRKADAAPGKRERVVAVEPARTVRTRAAGGR